MNKQELVQVNLFSPLIPFIDCIDVNVVDRSTTYVVNKIMEVTVTISLPPNLVFSHEKACEYFHEDLRFDIYLNGSAKIIGTLKSHSVAEYLFAEHSHLIRQHNFEDAGLSFCRQF